MLSESKKIHGTTPVIVQLVCIKEASQRLGVHPDTLRRWAKLGKLKCRRHPVNGYRLFEIDELYRLIGQIFGHE